MHRSVSDQTASPAGPQSALAYVELFPERLEIHRDAVLRGLGVSSDRPVHDRWRAMVDEELDNLPRLMRPRGIYRIDRVAALEPRRLQLESGAVFRGAIGQFLRHSEFVATFIVSIGSALERLARRELRGTKIMHGAVADAIASEAAEAVAEACRQHVRAWARDRGMDVTPPYSPGYCGMLVTEQRPLFASLPAERIHVRLTDSCLMLPVKSVSGLIGIAPTDKLSTQRYPCQICNHPHCMQRRVPFEPELTASFDWEDEPSTPKPVD